MSDGQYVKVLGDFRRLRSVHRDCCSIVFVNSMASKVHSQNRRIARMAVI